MNYYSCRSKKFHEVVIFFCDNKNFVKSQLKNHLLATDPVLPLLNILLFSPLDPPVQLSTIPINFPVKLTDPVTAVLYITSDYQHMQELKHTIHVKEVVHGKNLLKYFHEKIFAILVLLHLENRKN